MGGTVASFQYKCQGAVCCLHQETGHDGKILRPEVHATEGIVMERVLAGGNNQGAGPELPDSRNENLREYTPEFCDAGPRLERCIDRVTGPAADTHIPGPAGIREYVFLVH